MCLRKNKKHRGDVNQVTQGGIEMVGYEGIEAGARVFRYYQRGK